MSSSRRARPGVSVALLLAGSISALGVAVTAGAASGATVTPNATSTAKPSSTASSTAKPSASTTATPSATAKPTATSPTTSSSGNATPAVSPTQAPSSADPVITPAAPTPVDSADAWEGHVHHGGDPVVVTTTNPATHGSRLPTHAAVPTMIDSSVPVLSSVTAVAASASASALSRAPSTSAAASPADVPAAADTQSAALDADASSGLTNTDTHLASAESEPAGHGLPPWLIPALLLMLTSVVAVAGAVVGPRRHGQGKHAAGPTD